MSYQLEEINLKTVSDPKGFVEESDAAYMRKVDRAADLIIAKGQGNFESLEGDFSSRPIYFLLRAKCPVIQNYLGVSFGSLQIIGKNLDK